LHVIAKIGNEDMLKIIIEQGFVDLNYQNERTKETSLVILIVKL
jgi:hypothetical protein